MLNNSRFYHVRLPQTNRGFEMHRHLKKIQISEGMAEEKFFCTKQEQKRK